MEQSANVVVVNARPSAVVLISTTLVPGENDVPRQELEESIANPNGVVKGYFDDRTGFLSVKKGAKKARPLAQNLGKVSVERARDIIERTDDLSVLRQWSKGEKRPQVNQALTKRLRELEHPVATGEGEGDTAE